MKFHLTAIALALALAVGSVHADELKASTPAMMDNVGDGPSAPAVATSDPASKITKITASSPARKVATDYAPAQDLLLSAMSLIGVKYKWGGSTPEAGLDCSGFVSYVFKNSLNIVLPRTALGMSGTGETIDKTELKAGDLVFFNTLKRQFSHVGIYLGDGRFIHSPRKGRNIEVANMEDKYWTTRFNGARRMGELDQENVDIASLLQGRPARVPSANTDSKSCRKITSIRNGKKVTATVCARNASKPVVTKSSAKASTTAKSKTPAKKPAPKPPVKKKTPAVKPAAK